MGAFDAANLIGHGVDEGVLSEVALGGHFQPPPLRLDLKRSQRVASDLADRQTLNCGQGLACLDYAVELGLFDWAAGKHTVNGSLAVDVGGQDAGAELQVQQGCLRSEEHTSELQSRPH